MREIKFRYTFEDGIGCVIKHKDFTLEEIENKQRLFDCWKLLAQRQFIGLKDKNGKEIYEGDIISLKRKRFVEKLIFVESIGIIPKTKYKYVYPDNSGKWRYHLTLNYLLDKEYFKVIGNIYENPELVKKNGS